MNARMHGEMHDRSKLIKFKWKMETVSLHYQVLEKLQLVTLSPVLLVYQQKYLICC